MKKGISRREIAELLNASPSTIAGYVTRGMPLKTREAALRWLARNTGGGGGGWGGALRDRPSIAERAAALLNGQRKEPEVTPAETADEWGHWFLNQLRSDFLTVAPAAFRLLAAEFVALGERAPDVAAALAWDAVDAILSPAVNRLLPEYEWPLVPGYSFDVGEEADAILAKLQEVIDPYFNAMEGVAL